MPADASLRQVVKKYVPGASDAYANFWITSLFGQVQFYVLAKQPILDTHDVAQFDLPFLEEVAFFVARTSFLAVGLPEPDREAIADAAPLVAVK